MHRIEDRSLALPFRPRSEVPTVEPFDHEEADLARRQRRKEARLLAEATRPLDPWERYRALVDALEQGADLAEMADRKVRFAMVIMASLNIGLFALATRPELIGAASLPLRGWLGAYLLAYAMVAVYFFVQAVDALRPRPVAAPGEPPVATRQLRRLDGVIAQNASDYASAWREVRFDQLHHEIALQNHRLSQVNEEKYAALGRLYAGLKVLALLFGGLVLLAGLSSVRAAFGAAR